MWIKKRFQVEEISTISGIEQKIIMEWIEKEWIIPVHTETLTNPELDSEDLARVQLIQNLRDEMGVNDEGVSIVLHLLDQLHYLRSQFIK